MTLRHSASLAALSLAGAATVHAAFDATTMYGVNDLAPFTNLVQSQDIASTPFAFPFDNALFTNSGFERNVLDSNGNRVLDPGTGLPIVLDRTGLVTSVFQVTQQTQLAPGGLTLNVGDMVFAYTLRLVDNPVGGVSNNIVSTLDEFQVAGITVPGSDFLDPALVKGRGFVTPGAGVGAPQMVDTPTMINDFGSFGSQVAWNWLASDPTQQLDNGETITILMFTERSSIGNGFGNLLAPLSTSTGPYDPTLEGAPVLIPIAFIPAPGALGLFVMVGAVGLRRRR